MKLLRRKTQHFHRKLPCQKLMLRQIEWGVQNGPFPKNGVLPITKLPLTESWFDVPTTQMSIFILSVTAGVSFEGAFFL